MMRFSLFPVFVIFLFSQILGNGSAAYAERHPEEIGISKEVRGRSAQPVIARNLMTEQSREDWLRKVPVPGTLHDNA
ncbi:MAG: hypothetical protein JSW49_09990, partial [candidate division WOR-3 bacterium]